MLTDYHLHLRPDDTGEEAGRYFTEENVDRYLAAAEEHGIGELGVSEHVYRFREALEIWRHPYWQDQALDDLGAYCEFVRTTPLRLGLEMDFVPGARIGSPSCSRPTTSTTWSARSTSSAPTGALDDARYDVWEGSNGADELWRRYFEWLADLVRSGLYDILAHPDLIKIWGEGRPQPERDPRHYYEPAVEAIADSEIAVEVSTAGLRKPVGELYPSPRLRRDVRGGRRGLLALLGRARARPGRLRLRAGDRVHA